MEKKIARKPMARSPFKKAVTAAEKPATARRALAARKAEAAEKQTVSKPVASKAIAARKALAARRALAARKAAAARKSMDRKAAPVARTENSKKISLLAARFSHRLFRTVDATLVDVENTIKKNFPARFVSASLMSLRKKLRDNGIHSQFDRKVDRKELRASFDSKITKQQCDEAVDELAKCVIAEVEETLDQCDSAITAAAEKQFKMKRMAGRQIRSIVRRNLFRKGLEFNW
jgi:hypothetical protein